MIMLPHNKAPHPIVGHMWSEHVTGILGCVGLRSPSELEFCAIRRVYSSVVELEIH